MARVKMCGFCKEAEATVFDVAKKGMCYECALEAVNDLLVILDEEMAEIRMEVRNTLAKRKEVTAAKKAAKVTKKMTTVKKVTTKK